MHLIGTFFGIAWIIFGIFVAVMLLCFFFVTLIHKDKQITDIYLSSYVYVLFAQVVSVVFTESLVNLEIVILNRSVCQGFLWWTLSLQLADGLHMLCISIDQTLNLRLPRLMHSNQYTSLAKGRSVSFLLWLVACTASIPTAFIITVRHIVSDAGRHVGSPDHICSFETNDQIISWNVFVFIFSSFIISFSFASTVDSYLCWKQIHRTAKKPDSVDAIPDGDDIPVHSQSLFMWHDAQSINMGYCNSKMALVLCSVTLVTNFIPTSVLSVATVTSIQNVHYFRFTKIWLLILESVILPCAIMAVSVKHRHGAKMLLDKTTCGLFGWLQKGGATLHSVTFHNSASASSQIELMPQSSNYSQESCNNNKPNGKYNGHVVIHTANAKTCAQENLGFHVAETHKEPRITEVFIHAEGMLNNGGRHSNADEEREENSCIQDTENRRKNVSDDYKFQLGAATQKKSSFTGSTTRSKWKQQMQNQHFPGMFINKGFENEKKEEKLDDKNATYVSSSFHPDCIIHVEEKDDTFKETFDESDWTGSDLYDEGDIDDALERLSQLTRNSSGRSSDSFTEERFGNILTPEHTKRLPVVCHSTPRNETVDGADGVDNHCVTSCHSYKSAPNSDRRSFAEYVAELERVIKCETTSEDNTKSDIKLTTFQRNESGTLYHKPGGVHWKDEPMDSEFIRESTRLTPTESVRSTTSNTVDSGNTAMPAGDSEVKKDSSEDEEWPPIPTELELVGFDAGLEVANPTIIITDASAEESEQHWNNSIFVIDSDAILLPPPPEFSSNESEDDAAEATDNIEVAETDNEFLSDKNENNARAESVPISIRVNYITPATHKTVLNNMGESDQQLSDKQSDNEADKAFPGDDNGYKLEFTTFGKEVSNKCENNTPTTSNANSRRNSNESMKMSNNGEKLYFSTFGKEKINGQGAQHFTKYSNSVETQKRLLYLSEGSNDKVHDVFI